MGNAGITPSYLFNHAFPLTSAESQKEISQSMALKFMTFSPLFKPFVIHRGRSTALYAYAVNSKSSRCLLGAGLLLKLGII